LELLLFDEERPCRRENQAALMNESSSKTYIGRDCPAISHQSIVASAYSCLRHRFYFGDYEVAVETRGDGCLDARVMAFED
jgi:hypothetical protein